MKKIALLLIFVLAFGIFSNVRVCGFEQITPKTVSCKDQIENVQKGATNTLDSLIDRGYDIIKGSDQYNGLAYLDAQNRLKAVEGLQVSNLQFQAMFALMVGRAATAGEVAVVSESRAVVANGKVAGGGKGAVEAVKTTTRVGQWMSKAEYESFQKTGIVPRTNVLTKGQYGYEKQAAKGDYYVTFDIDSSLLVEKDVVNGWSLIKSKNVYYLKLAEMKGYTLPDPIGTNIEYVTMKGGQ